MSDAKTEPVAPQGVVTPPAEAPAGSPTLPTAATLTKVALSVIVLALVVGRAYSDTLKTNLDATAMTLLAVAIVPWLGRIFESIKVAGVEAKFREVERKIRDVQETAQEAKGSSASARRTAELAFGSQLASGDVDVDHLAREYETIRDTMASSPVRTEKMAGLVSRMMGLLRGDPGFHAAKMLESSSLGDRLSSYAYYLVHTAGAPVARMIEIVGAERKPFNQYWGLEAIGHVVSDPGLAFDRAKVRSMIVNLRNGLEPGTDRRDAADRILKVLDAGSL